MDPHCGWLQCILRDLKNIYVFKNNVWSLLLHKLTKHYSKLAKNMWLKINQRLWSVTLFTILICCSRKKGFRRLFTCTIKALTYTFVPVGLAHFTHSASIAWNREIQRSLVRGRGTSVPFLIKWQDTFSHYQSSSANYYAQKTPSGHPISCTMKQHTLNNTYKCAHINGLISS